MYNVDDTHIGILVGATLLTICNANFVIYKLLTKSPDPPRQAWGPQSRFLAAVSVSGFRV